ncbi:Bug family tripartite tricarboxylate transporter substrate binding protein [Halalkalibacterium ligniniphilum]|uniref:Bug family tripartite tricarboxylate transporter substrate binding protein n=1 Tax=Halalkalibacterium ligniniphilum TaxID=1134413 RepID=UPI0003471C20|nr:tripartite tricarboxylate transporter substrate binding protein [Halalkalibacterium ligniniphilum]
MNNKKFYKYYSLLLVGSIFLILAACSGNSNQPMASSNEESDSDEVSSNEEVEFPKKNITFVVPNSPGGGFDTTGRLLAEYWSKYLPNANFMIDNKPGAGGRSAYRAVERANPDGYTIGIFNVPGILPDMIFADDDINVLDMEWIGRVSEVQYMAAVSKDSDIETIDDLRNAGLVTAAQGNLVSAGTIGMLISANTLGFDIELIPHDGGSEAILSVVRGDITWTQFPIGTIAPNVKSGDITPLWVYSNERLEEFPDVPTIGELGNPDLVDLVSLHRAIAVTPGTPEEILNILRESFMKTVEDPEFQEKLTNLEGGKSDPLDHEGIVEIIENGIKNIEENRDLIEILYE